MVEDEDEDEDEAQPVGRGSLGGKRLVLVLVLLAAVFFVLLALLMVRVWSRAEERRKGATLAQQDQRREEERAAKRRACGLPPEATLHETVSVQGTCQSAVLQSWKSPGTAAFPGMFDEDGVLVSPDGCVTTYRSWVDAPNGHGENLRQTYLCTYDPRTGVATIDLL